jgi:hypothetical protein
MVRLLLITPSARPNGASRTRLSFCTAQVLSNVATVSAKQRQLEEEAAASTIDLDATSAKKPPPPLRRSACTNSKTGLRRGQVGSARGSAGGAAFVARKRLAMRVALGEEILEQCSGLLANLAQDAASHLPGDLRSSSSSSSSSSVSSLSLRSLRAQIAREESVGRGARSEGAVERAEGAPAAAAENSTRSAATLESELAQRRYGGAPPAPPLRGVPEVAGRSSDLPSSLVPLEGGALPLVSAALPRQEAAFAAVDKCALPPRTYLEVLVHDHGSVPALAALARCSSFAARRDANRGLCWCVFVCLFCFVCFVLFLFLFARGMGGRRGFVHSVPCLR